MIKNLLVLLPACFMALTSLAQNQAPPKREFRGAWIATFTNIDWPNRTQTPAQQQAAFTTIADHHKATGMNALFVQVRSQCDAMYASDIEPWSADLTGTQGKAPNPFWDPMQFAIEECHKRGMEFHAWLNPYRAVSNSNNLPGFAANHVAKQHPEWLLVQGTLRVLDPGIPAVRDHITHVITDILRRYDVDGIHFDDYFYPPAAGAGVTPYNDDSSYAADPRGFTDRGDWRRDNVNLLIKRIYDSVKSIKPWVQFGVSPSGIYRNSTNPDIGSNTSGLQHYVTLFADTRKWLQEGWIDYLCPQVYWYIGQPGANYAVVTPWWNNNAFGRHIYIGMAGYKVNDPAQGVNWANPSMIPNEVRLNRSLNNVFGQAIYNTNSLRSSTKLGFRDSLRFDFYRKPALLPTMLWRDSIAPGTPGSLTAVKYGNDSVVLNWTKPDAATELDKVRQFVVYRAESPVVDIANAENILTITNTDHIAFVDTSLADNTTYYYTVTATDRLHNESGNSNTVSTLPPDIQCPGDTLLVLNSSCAVELPDFTSLAVVNASSAVTITQIPAAGSVINGIGDTTVTLIATDAGGNADTCYFVVRTVDHQSPLITDISVDPAQLWPPNHQLRDVTVNYTVTDNCGPVSSSLAVTSNEPVTGPGYGNTTPDWVIVDEHHVKLRAERAGFGDGREYTIAITATDSSGNSTTQNATVTVPSWPDDEHGILTVKAFPNPTPTQFIILTLSTSPQPLNITVTNNAGSIVETRNNVPSTGLFYLGSSYTAGIYYLEVKQGNKKQTIKLIKLGH
jgi:uncharacterized lipoprotein YddW (UPF0748 family)